MAHLEIRKRNRRRIDRVELLDSLTIGRSALNSIVLQDAAVSRRHCVIETTDGATRLLDVGSREGIRVNRRRMREARLTDGDRISIGSYELIYHDDLEPAGRRAEACSAPKGEPIALRQEAVATGESRSPRAPARNDDRTSAPTAAEAIRRAEVLAERLDASERAWAEAEAALRGAEAAHGAEVAAALEAEMKVRAANDRLERDLELLATERDRLRRERDALAAELRSKRTGTPAGAETLEAGSLAHAEPAHAGPVLLGMLQGARPAAHRTIKAARADRDWGTWLITMCIVLVALAALAAVILIGRVVG